MKISFTGVAAPKSGSFVVLASEGPVLGSSAQLVDDATGGQISRAMAAADFEGSRGKTIEVLAPSGVKAGRIIVVGIGAAEDFSEKAQIELGGTIAGCILATKDKYAAIRVENIDGLKTNSGDFAANLAAGVQLRAYRFDHHKSKSENLPELQKLDLQSSTATAARRSYVKRKAVADGVCLARDLMNEPANFLHPEEFAKRLKNLEKTGLKVNVLKEGALKKLGMGSLLSVGLGSEYDCHVVTMEWNGGGKQAPIAFVGKGVTFDTGGISLKPGAGMGDMKGDMGGAACVSGLMMALAERKAKVNAVGLVGLVENMPDSRAMRPGDVVTSMSGQTIEVLNTDAEGRLVLADVLTYAQKTYKPRAIVDLATLTGAIIVALGHHHAGMFSNDDDLSANLSKAGEATGDLVWRMPLADAYDKMIDSKVADMKNIGGRDAGSITAAQFLARFVEDDVPWAHLDIAGTAMGSPKTATSKGWTSGFGVQLLNQLVADVYER